MTILKTLKALLAGASLLIFANGCREQNPAAPADSPFRGTWKPVQTAAQVSDTRGTKVRDTTVRIDRSTKSQQILLAVGSSRLTFFILTPGFDHYCKKPPPPHRR
jgi:hypothetical protein